jgi:hypothetical protein
MKCIFLAVLSVLLLASCSRHKTEHVERAFYFWKNNQYSLEEGEGELIKKLQTKKLYVKFFEVEQNAAMGTIPVAKSELSLYYRGDDTLSIIPVVYLRNEIFMTSNRASLDSLADNVHFLINKYKDEKYRDFATFTEYQMDCDWTPSTKDNYFYFLKKLKVLSGMQISCTLRLYPYKYPNKMGVPPVDKAMLMCYNLINPLQNHNKNSILDLKELSSYLGDYDYPLHLDIALPVYSWVQVYQNNQFTDVIYTNTKDIRKILKAEKPLWYQVTKDTVIHDFYLRAGDRVKIEEMDIADLRKAVSIITAKFPLDKNITVSLFHLDEQQLSRYTHEEISAIYSDFTKQ